MPLGVSSGYLTSSEKSITALQWIQRSSLPLAGFTTVMIVIIMVAQHPQETRASRPVWNSACAVWHVVNKLYKL